MKIKVIDLAFSICKLEDSSQIDISKEFTFFSKTDEENSLVCSIDFIPQNVVEREEVKQRAIAILKEAAYSIDLE